MNHSAAFLLEAPELGDWRAGNAGVEGVWQFDSGMPGRHVLLTALVHGNEICGAWALKGLLEAGVRPQRGRLTLAFCNLDAFDRFDPADHDASSMVEEDLNRQWLVERMHAANTLERRRAAELRPFVESADWLLDLHSMHERGAPLMLTGAQPLALLDLFADDVTKQDVIDALEQMHQPRDAFKFLYQCFVDHCASVTSDQAQWRIPQAMLEAVKKIQIERVKQLHRGIRPA